MIHTHYDSGYFYFRSQVFFAFLTIRSRTFCLRQKSRLDVFFSDICKKYARLSQFRGLGRTLLLKMGYIRPSVCRPCVRPCIRLFLVYAINSTVFIRFFFKLVQCLYINEDSNPIENGLHHIVRPCVRSLDFFLFTR